MFLKMKRINFLALTFGFTLSFCAFGGEKVQSMASSIDHGELLYGDRWGEKLRAACKLVEKHHDGRPVVAIYMESGLVERESKAVLISVVFEDDLSLFEVNRPKNLVVSIVIEDDQQTRISSKIYDFDRGLAFELWEACSSVCRVVASGRSNAPKSELLVSGPHCHLISTFRKGDAAQYRNHLGASIGPEAKGSIDKLVRERLEVVLSEFPKE